MEREEKEIKKTVAEILTNRGAKTRCYLIENKEGNFFVIHGSYLREVLFGELYDSFMLFKKNEVDWKYVEKRIKWDRDEEDSKREKRKWIYLLDVKNKVVDVENLTIDGEIQEIE